MRRLRILFLSHFVPFPPQGGCFQRNYNLLTRVGAHHDIHLIALRHKAATHPEAETREAREALLKTCRSVDIIDISDATAPVRMALRGLAGIPRALPLNVSIYTSSEVRRRIRERCAETPFDVVHFDTIGLAQYLSATGDIPRLLTHHGAESHMIRRRIKHEPSVLKKAYFAFEWLALRRYERVQCRRFDVNVVMSEDDGALMKGIAPGARFCPVDNGVDVTYFTPVEHTGARSIVFAGRLDQYSNRDGILYFMNEVWPGLKRAYPDVVIHLIGHNPPETLRTLAQQDRQVQLHGFVPDVRPFFQQSSVAICPMRDGGGTRIKVLDALALGMPIVATSISCEGIAVTPEHDVLIADSADAFITQIGRVFEDPSLRQRLAVNARALAERAYSWDALAVRLVETYRSVIRPVEGGRDAECV